MLAHHSHFDKRLSTHSHFQSHALHPTMDIQGVEQELAHNQYHPTAYNSHPYHQSSHFI